MNKEKRILLALESLDDKYLVQARPRGRKKRTANILATAASFVVVIGVVLSAVLVLGNNPPVGNNPSIGNNPPVGNNPSIGNNPSVGDNTFPEPPKPGKSLASVMEEYLQSDYGSDDPYDEGRDSSVVMPEGGIEGEDPVDNGSADSNGSYVEVTDNQVEGIIEGDLYKTTDKYIFRYGNKTLHVYSIDGDNSKEISSIYISSDGSSYYTDMFLSEDGKTVTLIQQEYVYKSEEHLYSGNDVTKVYSIDVSDVNDPEIAKVIDVAGLKKAVRKIDGRIYLVTTPGFDRSYIEPDNPETYIPGIIDEENDLHLCDAENIFYPDEITRVSYVYVNVLNENDLSVVSEYAILADHSTWVSGVYFTKNHILAEYQSGKKISEEESTSEAYSWIELIDFSGEDLRYRGRLEIKGWAETGQYSYDEQDGYLRIVVSTRAWKRYWTVKNNASIYVYDLSTMELSTSVENFAPEGECATAVRFEGDKLYVCTAETSKFTDPVFFFDLSDYDNITQVNTGYIEGFSSSLIDLGEGYLLGIGQESRDQGKVEVYKREGDSVVSVAEFLFYGMPGTVYKSYLIDRERKLFGFASNDFRMNENEQKRSAYVILCFDEGRLQVMEEMKVSSGDRVARAFYRDGYIYYTGNSELLVTELDAK